MKLLGRFAPPDDASPAEVRRVGLRNALLGLIAAAFGVAIVLSLDRLARGALLDPTTPRPSKLRAVSGVPVVIGFLAMTIGLYRALTGVHPSRDGGGVLRRALQLALVALIAAALLLLVVTALVWLGRLL